MEEEEKCHVFSSYCIYVWGAKWNEIGRSRIRMVRL